MKILDKNEAFQIAVIVKNHKGFGITQNGFSVNLSTAKKESQSNISAGCKGIKRGTKVKKANRAVAETNRQIEQISKIIGDANFEMSGKKAKKQVERNLNFSHEAERKAKKLAKLTTTTTTTTTKKVSERLFNFKNQK